MAKNDDTEERKLPPTQTKIDRLRREGQVPRSKDIPAAFSVLLITVFLVWTFQSLLRDLASGFEFSLTLLPEAGNKLSFGYFPGIIADALLHLLLIVAVPMLIGVLAALITAIIDGQGFPFSFKHMSFDLARLNPAEGLKRIFSLSSLSEFLKSIIKFALLAAAGAGTLLYFLNALFWAPLCGERCSLAVSTHLIGTLTIIASMIMLLAAAFDIRISRALFRYENRMSKTEAKREHKDSQGNPEMKSARRQIGAEMRREPPRKQSTPERE